MTGIIKKSLILTGLFLLLGLGFVSKAQAQQLQSVSDTISTSRPSGATPIAVDQAANATQVTVFNNGSIFLASDSATLLPSIGETLNTVLISSMSAVGIPSASQRYVYFGGPCAGTGCAANTHHNGDVIINPITATHTIKFTPSRQIPSGGFITINFPTTTNTASPSASGFSFNGMTSASGLPTNIVTNNVTCTSDANTTVSGNSITCKTTGSVNAGVAVTIIVGCTTQSSGVCTAFKPQLINPTKTLTAGNADQWSLSIQTTDAGGAQLDSGTAAISTIESVQVQGTVQPYITFSIAGVANGTSICSGNDTTNPGAGKDSTATFVDLGVLTNTQINVSAQTLTVSTNGGAYTITATSSGRFANPASGFFFPDANGGNGLTANDTPAPAALTTGTTAFGIHPCSVAGTYAPTIATGTWGTGGATGTANAKYSNPWHTGNAGFYANISSYSSGATSNSQTTVEYAATANATVPSGTYSTVFTYVATPTF